MEVAGTQWWLMLTKKNQVESFRGWFWQMDFFLEIDLDVERQLIYYLINLVYIFVNTLTLNVMPQACCKQVGDKSPGKMLDAQKVYRLISG